jgi:hypothetical protein
MVFVVRLIGACTHKSGSVIDVRFTPDATKLLRSSEMTRCANRDLTRRSKNIGICALMISRV